MIERIQRSTAGSLIVTVSDGPPWSVLQPCETWHQRVIDDWVAAGGEIEDPPAPPPPSVDDLIARIDAEAEAVRAQYITPGSGQAMVYGAKQAEARAYQAAGKPSDLTDYPLLGAEVGITTPTASEIAALWLAMEAQWIAAAADRKTHV